MNFLVVLKYFGAKNPCMLMRDCPQNVNPNRQIYLQTDIFIWWETVKENSCCAFCTSDSINEHVNKA